MKPTFRKSMIWLHTYTGLFGGWLLFAIFLTGTLSYYNTEISHWMSSEEVSKPLNNESQLSLLKQGITLLEMEGTQAQRWSIKLPDERGSHFVVNYRIGRKGDSIYLDANSKTLAAPNTRGGDFFRTFHYTLSLRDWGGRYFTGVAAMLMLIGVFTGIYTHRRFFKDFFTLRTNKKRQFLTDFHAISGIVTIPFCFIICLSALFIYINLYQPLTVTSYFDNYRALDSKVSTSYPRNEAKNVLNTDRTDFNKIWQQLEAQWGGNFKVSSVTINNPQDIAKQIIVNRYKQANLSNKSESLAFDYLGNQLTEIEEERFARKIRRIFYGLHEAHFASPALRAMLFTLGLLATLIISTGTILWVRKRQSKKDKAVYHWTDKTNNACFYGLTLAIASYFFTSKSGIFTDPKAVELSILFYTWLTALVLSIFLPSIQSKHTLIACNAVAYWTLLGFDIVGPKAYLVAAINTDDIPHLTVTFLVFLTSIFFTYILLKAFATKTIKDNNRNEFIADLS